MIVIEEIGEAEWLSHFEKHYDDGKKYKIKTHGKERQ